MRSLRDNFPDARKAEIFVRDRAMCCYSGKSLWLLDYGGEPALEDQVDHVTPASTGGASGVDNGVLATFLHNYVRGSKVQPLRLFDNGLPNLDAFWLLGHIPEHIVGHIKRFGTLHCSDWYLNRAIASVRRASTHRSGPLRKDGRAFKRGAHYYCRAALKRLGEWRRIARADNVPSIERRGLLPTTPRVDHEPLLALLEAESAEAVLNCAERLEPFLNASHAAVEGMFDLVQSKDAFERYLDEVRRNPLVVEPTKRAIGDYVEQFVLA